MNQELKQLYLSRWEGLLSEIKPILDDENLEVKPANPLLITFDDENDFKHADLRIMFFGQETNTWCGEFRTDVGSILEEYDKFYNKEVCWSYGGQFWNGVGRFFKLLQEKYPNKEIRFIWNNIVKIGKDGDKGFPPDYIYEVERGKFSVIKEELEIVKPNIVLFLTGPNYDSMIADNFGKVVYSPIAPYTGRWLSKIELEGIDFSFRTYHPNFLWRNNIDKVFNTIINEIKA